MYNGHIHVFNSKCVPDDFLKIGIPGKIFDGLAERIKTGLETKIGRTVLKALLAHGNNEKKIKRIIAFFDIGVEASQRKVFERINAVYNGCNAKYFALTLNMDYMTDKVSVHADFETQLMEVMQLKQTYPSELLVFLSCDPRYKKGNALKDWFRSYYEEGKAVGIKIYPALGFFPFDPAMEKLYEYAAQYNVPVVTHTTRTGAFYLGRNIKDYVGIRPPSLDPDNPIMQSIYARIGKYRASTHRKLKLNDNYCNIFSHPENYIPIIEKYPALKLCFAHYGGTNEILRKTESYMLDVENSRDINWTDLIRNYIKKYPGVYTDISYSLADKRTYDVFLNDIQDPVLREKFIFGTDYFMEEQEDSEANVFAYFKSKFMAEPGAFKLLTQENPYRLLYEKVEP